MTKEQSLIELRTIPGIGKSLAIDLWNIGVKKVSDLKGQDPETLYDLSNRFAGSVQDRCVLYTFRCAVYFASTPVSRQNPDKLKWWNWKDMEKSN
jgi:hypothetical protein